MNPATRPPAPVVVFDIETVPDIPLLESTYDFEGSFEPSTLWRNVQVAHAIAKKNEIRFFSPIFHIPISICAVVVHPETQQIMDGFKRTIPLPESYSDFRKAERQLLLDFWNFSNKYSEYAKVWYDTIQSDMRMSDYQRKKLKPIPVTFCGYNISEFDLPVIEQRSMSHLLTCPLEDYAKDSGTDSYRYKFAQDKVYDLLHFISNFIPSAKARLDVFSRAMGLGGKMHGMDGSRVADEYYESKNWNKIEEYCAIDVLITYGVYLVTQKFRGLLAPAEFAAAVAHFKQFLLQEGRPASYKDLAENSDSFFLAASV